MQIEHPWQVHPTELISCALEHLHRPTEGDQRIAFLLLDVGVETILKTYLLLPQEVIGEGKPSYSKREGAVDSGSFYAVLQMAWETARDLVQGIQLSYVLYFHRIRNKLYHQGDGVVVTAENADAYARLAVEILRRLLEVDLQPQLSRPQLELKERETTAARLEETQHVQGRLRKELNRIDRLVRISLEEIEPEFLTANSESLEADLGRDYPGLPEELVVHLEEYIPRDGEQERPFPDWLHKELTLYDLKWLSEPIPPRWVRRRRFIRIASEFSLACADADSIDIFIRADHLAWTDPHGDLSSWVASDGEDCLTRFRESCEEALADLEAIHAAIFEKVLGLKTQACPPEPKVPDHTMQVKDDKTKTKTATSH